MEKDNAMINKIQVRLVNKSFLIAIAVFGLTAGFVGSAHADFFITTPANHAEICDSSVYLQVAMDHPVVDEVTIGVYYNVNFSGHSSALVMTDEGYVSGYEVFDATAGLSRGVNTIKTWDDDGCGDSIDVTSSGASGPSISWSGDPYQCSYGVGFWSHLKVCCLTPDQEKTESGPYSIEEFVSWSGSCQSGSSAHRPFYHGTDANGCFTQDDDNVVSPPGWTDPVTGFKFCNCSSTATQVITLTGPGFNVSLTDYMSYTYGACPSGKPATLTMSGVAVTKSNDGSATRTCE